MDRNYHYVIIETFLHKGGASKHSIRARPLSGQGFATSMHVECSSTMREGHPIGTLFKIQAKVKDTMQQHLYSSWQWAFDVVTAKEAKDFIAQKGLGKK